MCPQNEKVGGSSPSKRTKPPQVLTTCGGFLVGGFAAAIRLRALPQAATFSQDPGFYS